MNNFIFPYFLLLFLILCKNFHTVQTIDCFQCDSNNNLECSELFDHSSSDIQARPCEEIHEAKFCIKSTGIFSGQVGTMRNCSSRDLGNYCTYLKRLGDDRPTRSCIYTCSSDGCNAGISSHNSCYLFFIFAIIATILLLYKM